MSEGMRIISEDSVSLAIMLMTILGGGFFGCLIWELGKQVAIRVGLIPQREVVFRIPVEEWRDIRRSNAAQDGEGAR